MTTIPTAAQMASNPSKYALRDYSAGLAKSVRMSVTIDGKRVPLTPEAVRKAQRERSAGSTLSGRSSRRSD